MRLLVLILSLALTASAAPKQRTVTLDVTDGEARAILKSVQKQCGIRNLIIDPDVQGSGTFYFRDVPCDKALPIILRTMGLSAQTYPSSLVRVESR